MLIGVLLGGRLREPRSRFDERQRENCQFGYGYYLCVLVGVKKRR